METLSGLDSQGGYSFKKIAYVTLPILFSMLMEYLIGMTDTAFLGRVSEVALGASAMGSVYFLTFFVLGSGFAFGAQILIGRRNGEQNFSSIGPICYAGGFFLILFSLLLMAFIKFSSPVILPGIIQSESICAATIEYLDWRLYGLLFVFITAIYRSFYVGIARTAVLSWSSVIMVFSNILLNYGLIFGKYGLPEMGVAGAALASSIAEGIAMLCYIGYTCKRVDLKKYGFDRIRSSLDFSILKKVFQVSFWMMVQSFVSVGVWFFFYVAVEHLGERSLAVINLARTLSGLPFILIHSFATGGSSLISNLMGEGKAHLVWHLIRKVLCFAFAVVTPLLIFYILFPELTLGIYTDNTALIRDSVPMMYVMSAASFLQIAAFILFNAVSGTGAIRAAVTIEFCNLFLYVLMVWIGILRLRPSPAAAWSVEIYYQTLTILFCILYLFFGKWKEKKL